jgi:hypothetical protein
MLPRQQKTEGVLVCMMRSRLQYVALETDRLESTLTHQDDRLERSSRKNDLELIPLVDFTSLLRDDTDGLEEGFRPFGIAFKVEKLLYHDTGRSRRRLRYRSAWTKVARSTAYDFADFGWRSGNFDSSADDRHVDLNEMLST